MEKETSKFSELLVLWFAIVNELQTLANCKFSTVEQAHLDDLLARNAESKLSSLEIAELDRLLIEVDYLMVLKARARYTLKCLDDLALVA
jgi:hypothetical protein